MPKVKLTPEEACDRLGRIKAKIADLTEQAEDLKQVLIDSGYEAVEGKLFRATVSTFDRTKRDYKGLLEYLAPSQKVLNSYTTVESQTTVRLVARNGN